MKMSGETIPGEIKRALDGLDVYDPNFLHVAEKKLHPLKKRGWKVIDIDADMSLEYPIYYFVFQRGVDCILIQVSDRGVKVSYSRRLDKFAESFEGELIGVRMSEWSRCQQYFLKNGFEEGLKLLAALEKSPSIRPGPRQAYRSILKAMRKYKDIFEKLSKDELAELMDYIGRELVARRSEEVLQE